MNIKKIITAPNIDGYADKTSTKKIFNMRKILTLAAGLIIMTACAQKSQKAIVKSEPTTITWIEDKPGPTIQPQKLYPEVPDSLWAALGLEKGVPSSMSCLLLQTEGKTILLDAGLGAPFS